MCQTVSTQIDAWIACTPTQSSRARAHLSACEGKYFLISEGNELQKQGGERYEPQNYSTLQRRRCTCPRWCTAPWHHILQYLTPLLSWYTVYRRCRSAIIFHIFHFKNSCFAPSVLLCNLQFFPSFFQNRMSDLLACRSNCLHSVTVQHLMCVITVTWADALTHSDFLAELDPRKLRFQDEQH